jgi:hypothetical protein
MPKIEFTKSDLAKAMEQIARGDVPKWMNAIEKQAYALGVIVDEHIIDCPKCKGRGWLPDCNPYADAMCHCPGSTGKVISDEGKALVKMAFPEYKIRPKY